MRNVPAIITFLAFAAACGKPTSPQKYTVVAETFFSNPLVMKKEITECQETSFEKDQKDFTLTLFLNGKEDKATRTFDELLDGSFVRDPHKKSISQSVYGEEIHFEHTVHNGLIGAPQLVKKKPGKDITLCPEIKEYGAQSVESAALNSSYYIHEVYKKVKDLVQTPIEPIILKIGTLEKRTFNVVARKGELEVHNVYRTDNAFYDGQERSIIFVPHSQEVRDKGFKTSFWQIPMVAAHEYGHHLFQTLFNKGKFQGVLFGCFQHGFQNPEIGVLGIEQKPVRMVTNIHVEYALNEGFADLIGHYSLSESERELVGVPGMQHNREVTDSHFMDGQQKAFHEAALDDFFSGQTIVRAKGDLRTNFQERHMMGAIFAHSANEFFGQLGMEYEKRLELILDWARKLGNHREELMQMSPREHLIHSLKILTRNTLVKLGRKWDATTCEAAASLLGPTAELPECDGL